MTTFNNIFKHTMQIKAGNDRFENRRRNVLSLNQPRVMSAKMAASRQSLNAGRL